MRAARNRSAAHNAIRCLEVVSQLIRQANEAARKNANNPSLIVDSSGDGFLSRERSPQ